MKKYFNFLISFIFILITFAVPETTQGMDVSNLEEEKKIAGIQLKKVTDDTLEAVLGTGNDILLKISLDLKTPPALLGTEQVEVPVRLFLTNFESSPMNDQVVCSNYKVDFEPTKPTCILPKKPEFFNSYTQFSDWLNEGYFTNEIRITYDFHVDVQKLASSLVKKVSTFSPEGYHIIGTHIVHTKVMPSSCVPKIAYVSERGKKNATTVTLGGTLELSGFTHSIEDHQQIFPHSESEKILFQKDETKKFYSHKWLAKSEETAKVTYEEFPKQQAQDWPNSPSGTYSLLQQKPGDLENIDHLDCWDGNSGEKVDISDGRIFSLVGDATNSPSPFSSFIERIVKDEDGNLYTISHKNTEGSSYLHNYKNTFYRYSPYIKPSIAIALILQGAYYNPEMLNFGVAVGFGAGASMICVSYIASLCGLTTKKPALITLSRFFSE